MRRKPITILAGLVVASGAILMILLGSTSNKPSLDNWKDQDDKLKTSMARGQKLYAANCQSCHMSKGEGIASVFPPLAKSDYLMADKERAAKQILNGVSGEITVNGITYNGAMAAFPLTNDQVADILNYITNSWGNKGKYTSPSEIETIRNQ